MRFSEKPRPSGDQIDLEAIITPSRHVSCSRLPELLAPAGSPDALGAAILAGADAVYFGGGEHNARINAHNFTREELRDAISLLHFHGKKAYITLNTLVYQREIDDYLRFAEFAANAGADALITADLGGAAAIRRHIPELELHASTQMSCHSLDGARALAELGFSRVVCAREMSREDIATLCRESPIEIEAFVHGALCVCHSGQCLFSSVVGGRSGNRGECAQPCRLPYSQGANGNAYPLSLKDLSLAGNIRELLPLGISSLKIEGRMKSPEYVFGVTLAFRRLLDAGRDATDRELDRLARIFSRGGFTDGYFKGRIDSSMLGVRSELDKLNSKGLKMPDLKASVAKKEEKTAVHIAAKIKKDAPATISMSAENARIEVVGSVPDAALNAPLTEESVKKSLLKLGGTPFEAAEVELELDEGVILPVSALNALRREAADKLADVLKKQEPHFDSYLPAKPQKQKKKGRSARFVNARQIPDGAQSYFDIIFLPLDKFDGEANGVILPPVIFDSEREQVKKMLLQAKEKGAKYALVGNIGALSVVNELDMTPIGDLRLNACNDESVAELEALGIEELILSPELTLPQMRDIKGDTAAVVYGRLPLMLLEKCVIREIADCNACGKNSAELTDRRGMRFPVLREWEHRNTVYNSVPVYMADKQTELDNAGITNRHFIFSTESREECERVIEAYKRKLSPRENEKIKRI